MTNNGVSEAWLLSALIAAGINESSCNQQKLEPEEKWKMVGRLSSSFQLVTDSLKLENRLILRLSQKYADYCCNLSNDQRLLDGVQRGLFGCCKMTTTANRLIVLLLFQWIILKSYFQLTLISSVAFNMAVQFEICFTRSTRSWWLSSLSAPAGGHNTPEAARSSAAALLILNYSSSLGKSLYEMYSGLIQYHLDLCNICNPVHQPWKKLDLKWLDGYILRIINCLRHFSSKKAKRCLVPASQFSVRQ